MAWKNKDVFKSGEKVMQLGFIKFYGRPDPAGRKNWNGRIKLGGQESEIYFERNDAVPGSKLAAMLSKQYIGTYDDNRANPVAFEVAEDSKGFQKAVNIQLVEDCKPDDKELIRAIEDRVRCKRDPSCYLRKNKGVVLMSELIAKEYENFNIYKKDRSKPFLLINDIYRLKVILKKVVPSAWKYCRMEPEYVKKEQPSVLIAALESIDTDYFDEEIINCRPELVFESERFYNHLQRLLCDRLLQPLIKTPEQWEFIYKNVRPDSYQYLLVQPFLSWFSENELAACVENAIESEVSYGDALKECPELFFSSLLIAGEISKYIEFASVRKAIDSREKVEYLLQYLKPEDYKHLLEDERLKTLLSNDDVAFLLHWSPQEDDSDDVQIEELETEAVAEIRSRMRWGRGIYQNRCWCCKAPIDSRFLKQCPSCYWYRCANCGHCASGCHCVDDYTTDEFSRKKILQYFAEERAVKYLIHFTRASNLRSILSDGILPRDSLPEGAKVLDEFRLDGMRDCSCFSVSFPNYKMFYKYRELYKDQLNDDPFVVLLIDPQIIMEKEKEDVYYLPVNAASGSVHNRFGEYIGLNAAKGMFSDRKLGETKESLRETLNLPVQLPTDPQAEVLIRNKVSPKYILGIGVNSEYSANKVRQQIPLTYHSILFNGEALFRSRMDSRFWGLSK